MHLPTSNLAAPALQLIELNLIVWVGYFTDRNAGNAIRELEVRCVPVRGETAAGAAMPRGCARGSPLGSPAHPAELAVLPAKRQPPAALPSGSGSTACARAAGQRVAGAGRQGAGARRPDRAQGRRRHPCRLQGEPLLPRASAADGATARTRLATSRLPCKLHVAVSTERSLQRRSS